MRTVAKPDQNNPSFVHLAAVAFNQGGKQWKPQCAKSPQFLSTDRFQTSYSDHPSTSFASLPLFCHFLTVSSILCIRDGRKCTLCLFCVIHCAMKSFAECSTYSIQCIVFFVCSVHCAVSTVHCTVCIMQCARPHYGSFRIPAGTLGQETPGCRTDFMSHHPIIKLT